MSQSNLKKSYILILKKATEILRQAENSICKKIVQESVSDAYCQYCKDFLMKKYYLTLSLVRKQRQRQYYFIVFYNNCFKNRMLRIEMKRRIDEYDMLLLCPHTFNKVIPEVWLIKKKEGFSIVVSMTLRKKKWSLSVVAMALSFAIYTSVKNNCIGLYRPNFFQRKLSDYILIWDRY